MSNSQYSLATSFFLVLVLFCPSSNCFSDTLLIQNPKYHVAEMTDQLPDGTNGPEMIIIPAGQFNMGSPDSETGRYQDESPLHIVRFKKSFALGKKEITVGEFAKFVSATNYVTDAEKHGGGLVKERDLNIWVFEEINWRLDHEGNPALPDYPVVHVSWHDAKQYTQWLSQQTGHHYRLPSEAEFEYANRGGSNTLYWWGNDSPQHKVANIKGEKDQTITPEYFWQVTDFEHEYAFREGNTAENFSNYGDGFGGPAPVGSFIPNNFGLYDVSGNVWEWVEDCWHSDYRGAPEDGSAWTEHGNGNCDLRITRGGSWYCFPRHVRAANRYPLSPFTRTLYTGFRVARDLS